MFRPTALSRPLLPIALLLVIAAACAAPAGAPAADQMAAPAAAEAMEAPSMEAPPVSEAAAPSVAASGAIEYNLGTDASAQPPAPSDRKIIKNGEQRLEVQDTDVAIDRVTQIASDAGGYIVSSRTWFANADEASYKYAMITLGVPADQFEPVLRRLRAVALRVLDETASGEDVTDQFVDLESKLENLKVTRDRLRTFLDRAQTVEEALKVNQDLAAIEEEIATVQGRINYLAGRSSYSTIVVNLEPAIPPAPTPTLIPTATPVSWNPGETVSRAGDTLRAVTQNLLDILIWFVIVVVPIVAPLLLIAWAIWYFGFARRRKGG